MEKVKINKIKNQVLVNFNEQFYKKGFIDQAILDFNEVCEVDQTEDGLLLRPKGEVNLDILGYEFYNYVLGLMKN
ncbi:MAG: HxsD-like protein [Nanoarchaeota archaeon]|nr:HxsD-like protein [Nanoarchaeota archaeon]